MVKLINITQLANLLNLVNSKTKKPLNYVLRYWEKEFNEIKPTILNKRRYYSEKQINLIKLIKFLLKDKGMTIKGVKNVLNSKINSLDDYNLYSLKSEYQKKVIKEKSNLIFNKINKIKKYGKKNTLKS